MADNGGSGLSITDDIWPGMSIWAFLIIVVSVIVVIIIAMLFMRMRKNDRKRQWSDVLYDKNRRQKYDESKQELVKQIMNNDNLLGHDSFTQSHKTNKVVGWEEKRPERLESSNVHDFEDVDASVTYAEPDVNEKDVEENRSEVVGISNDGDNMHVLREAAPGSDVLYAVPMKTSFRKSVKKEEDGEMNEKKDEIKVGEITLPASSSMGTENASLYEEVDLTAVAMATMSTDNDTPRTEL